MARVPKGKSEKAYGVLHLGWLQWWIISTNYTLRWFQLLFLLFYIACVQVLTMPHLDDCIPSHFSVFPLLSPCAMLYTKYTPDQVNSIAQWTIKSITIAWISQPDIRNFLKAYSFCPHLYRTLFIVSLSLQGSYRLISHCCFTVIHCATWKNCLTSLSFIFLILAVTDSQ